MALIDFSCVALAMLIMFGILVSAQDCSLGALRGLLKECRPFLRRYGPKIDPSQACCDVVTRVIDLSCKRSNVPDDVKETVSMIKVTYVAKICKATVARKKKSTHWRTGSDMNTDSGMALPLNWRITKSGMDPSPTSLPAASDKSTQTTMAPTPAPDGTHKGTNTAEPPTLDESTQTTIVPSLAPDGTKTAQPPRWDENTQTTIAPAPAPDDTNTAQAPVSNFNHGSHDRTYTAPAKAPENKHSERHAIVPLVSHGNQNDIYPASVPVLDGKNNEPRTGPVIYYDTLKRDTWSRTKTPSPANSYNRGCTRAERCRH